MDCARKRKPSKYISGEKGGGEETRIEIDGKRKGQGSKKWEKGLLKKMCRVCKSSIIPFIRQWITCTDCEE